MNFNIKDHAFFDVIHGLPPKYPQHEAYMKAYNFYNQFDWKYATASIICATLFVAILIYMFIFSWL